MALKFPQIFLLTKDIQDDARYELEDRMDRLECRPLTYDAREAEVFLGKVYGKQRALLELRRLKILTEEVVTPNPLDSPHPNRKIIVIDNTDSEISLDEDSIMSPTTLKKHASGTVKVVKLNWYTDSIEQGKVLPYGDYLVYEGRKVEALSAKETPIKSKAPIKPPATAEDIMKRAMADSAGAQAPSHSYYRPNKRRSEEPHSSSQSQRPKLHHQTTSEQDINAHLPPIPDFMHSTYSCQRPTLLHPPNEAFIEQLIKVRTVRQLTGDKIGVRAYSTSIAALSAYPHALSTAAKVARLPGCGAKIATLFEAWTEDGVLREAAEAEADERMQVLQQFAKIWGVADTTAREFFNKGWRDLDDIVEYGWNSLTRVQQIGVKYFDELQDRVPRSEVQRIADALLLRAREEVPGMEMVVVGGYRRGKELSGDVDVVLSHRDESKTAEFIEKLVMRLEKDGFITHTLSLTTRNTQRGQKPVAWKAEKEKPGSGFDTLDKALTVWQDPEWEQDGKKHRANSATKKKNPNPHRQVDIIISPWKTVGCAVVGWSGGTTFQRDLRRYCKKERNLKFDSSGVRSRADGAWVDLESNEDGPAPDMLTAERRVFEGLGLTFRPPTERCTG